MIAALANLILIVATLSHMKDFLMKHRLMAAAVVACAFLLSGCGLTQLSRGAADLLPDYEIRQVPKVTCSQFLQRIDPDQALTNAQQRSALGVCEEMTKGAVVRPSEVQDAIRNSIPGVPF